MTKKKNRPLQILIADDDADDLRLIQKTIERSGIKSNLFSVSTGDEALDFLRKKQNDKNDPSLDLVLLDLNMPGKNGYEVLQEIKTSPELQNLTVAIISGASTDLVRHTIDTLGFDIRIFKKEEIMSDVHAVLKDALGRDLPKDPAD